MSTSPAAVCQCLTLVSLCTSIADPNWIQVTNSSDPDGKQLIYGVAFTLHAAQNLTDTGPLGGVNSWGMWSLYTLAGLCYSAVLVSSSSFLLDFLGAGVSHPRLLVSLHLSTVALLLSILGVWGACLYIIYHNLQGGKLWSGAWGARASPSARAGGGAAGMRPSPGESFYIAVLGLLFSCAASVISIKGLREMRPPAPLGHAQGGATAVGEEGEEGEEDGEDSDTEPLLPRQPAQGSERGEEWGAGPSE